MPILDEAKLPNFRGGGGRYQIEMTINPMQSAHDAPRCKANSKRTGEPCRGACGTRLSRLSNAWSKGWRGRPASVMETIGTARARKRRSKQ
jgi:hypothetical protein